MAKIKVTSKCAIYDGMIMTFKAPCDCTVADGINVYFQDEKQTFFFRDAHGNDVSEIDDLFTIDTYVTVSLDTTNGYAYLQNADTNAYLEEVLAGKANKTHGHDLTDSVITGTLSVSKGGTGADSADAARENLGAAATDHTHAATDITEGFLPLERGGMGKSFANAPANAILRNSGNDTGLWYTQTANGAFYATGADIGAKFGTLPVAQGGTGGTSGIAARKNLGAKIFFTLAELGITTFPTTMKAVVAAMPDQSVLIMDSRNILTGGSEEISDLGLANAGMYLFLRGNTNARVSLLNIYGATSATATYMNHGCYAATNNAVVWQQGDRTDGTYPDCRYRSLDSEKEWINPPMVFGTEYRTTERWNKKVVFTKLVDCGTMTNNSTFTYSTETVKPVRFAGYVSSGALPILMEVALNSTWKMWVDVLGSLIHARIASGYTNSAARIYVQVWYTKS